jgi:hypothetical protein
MSRKFRLATCAGLAVLAAGVLAACASGPGAATLVGQAGRIEVADSDFAVTLPTGWLAIGLTGADIDKLLGTEGNKDVAESLRQQAPALLAAGVKLWAFDTGTGAGSSLQVIVQSGPTPMATLRKLAQQFIDTGSDVVRSELTDVTVSGNEAVRLDYGLERASGAGTTVKADGIQVYVSTKTTSYIFAITIAGGGAVTAGDEIVGSIEFLE